MMFVNPANTAEANEPVAQVTSTLEVPKAAPAAASEPPAAARDELMEPVGQTSRYQAKVGDTLSGIAVNKTVARGQCDLPGEPGCVHRQ
jgi:hypothetical protein